MIYILTHREIPDMETKWFTPLHISDNDNNLVELKVKDCYPLMSKMNRWYNELSGQYYIWKKDNTEYKGQVQYRMVPKLSFEEVKVVLKTKDFIVHSQEFACLKSQFIGCHGKEAWEIAESLLKERGFDDKLIETWSKSKVLFNRNTLIAKADDFNDYSQWLFDIIFDLEKKMNISNMDDVFAWSKTQKCLDPNPERFAGYLAERLFTLYLYQRYGDYESIRNAVYCSKFENLHSRLPVG